MIGHVTSSVACKNSRSNEGVNGSYKNAGQKRFGIDPILIWKGAK